MQLQYAREDGTGPSPAPGANVPRLGKHVAALDGLRGLAILFVMNYHLAWAAPAVSLPAKVWVFFTTFGWTGVDLFFVLSGFLITGILLDSKEGPGYFRNFYARRVLRIFPLYYGVLAVVLVILPLFVSYDTPALRLLLQEQGWLWAYSANISVALRHGEWVWTAGWLRLGVLWSLAVEEHFYFVWPLLVFLLPRRTLMRVSVALVVLTPFARLAARLADVPPGTVYALTPFRADALALGALLALVVRDPDLHRKTLRRAPWVALASCTLIAGMAFRRRVLDHYDLGFQFVGYTAVILAYGALVLAAVSAPASSRFRRVLSSPRLTFFGKYSYGAYMFHDLLRPAYLRFFSIATLQRFVHLEVLAFIVHATLAITITFAIAVVSFHLYEKRFLELKRFFEYRKAPAPADVPSEVLSGPGPG